MKRVAIRSFSSDFCGETVGWLMRERITDIVGGGIAIDLGGVNSEAGGEGEMIAEDELVVELRS
jgi:hypothetical protein